MNTHEPGHVRPLMCVHMDSTGIHWDWVSQTYRNQFGHLHLSCLQLALQLFLLCQHGLLQRQKQSMLQSSVASHDGSVMLDGIASRFGACDPAAYLSCFPSSLLGSRSAFSHSVIVCRIVNLFSSAMVWYAFQNFGFVNLARPLLLHRGEWLPFDFLTVF